MLTFTNEKHHSTCLKLMGAGEHSKNESESTSLIASNNKQNSYTSYFGGSESQSTESCGAMAYNFSTSSSFGSSIASAFSCSVSSGGFSSGGSVSSGGGCCYSC